MDSVMKYGFDGKVPEENDPAWEMGLDQIFETIKLAQDRYVQAQINGAKSCPRRTSSQINGQGV